MQRAMAFPALFGAAAEDPLEAAAVTFGDDEAAFFAEAREVPAS